MNQRDHLEPELRAFLSGARIERRLTPMMRARAMANARAIVAAGGALRPATVLVLPSRQAAPVARRFRQLRVAVAGAIVIAVGAAGAVAALRARSPRGQEPPAPQPARVAAAIQPTNVSAPSPRPAPVAAKQFAAARAARSARPIADADPFAAEIAVLQPAHAAHARGDFANALILVAEHARRFPRGHLAEEREALRVRSLAGAGRTEEARRAAAAFAARFPRSILLPHLEGRTLPP